MSLWRKVKLGLIASSLFGTVLAGCSLNREETISNNAVSQVEKVNKKENFELNKKAFYGDTNAPNTVIVFSDYQCGACQSYHEKTLNKIKSDYVANGKVKVYLFDLAFVTEVSLVKALLSAAFEKEYPEYYTKFVDEMYHLNDGEDLQFKNRNFVSEKLHVLFPKLDTEHLINRVFEEDKNLMAVIKENKNLASEKGVESTPTVFVNGVRMINPFELNEFQSLLLK